MEALEGLQIAIGLLVSAAIGILYFFSQRFRENKQKEWENKESHEVRSEWLEWLFSVFVVATLAAVALGIAYR